MSKNRGQSQSRRERRQLQGKNNPIIKPGLSVQFTDGGLRKVKTHIQRVYNKKLGKTITIVQENVIY